MRLQKLIHHAIDPDKEWTRYNTAHLTVLIVMVLGLLAALRYTGFNGLA